MSNQRVPRWLTEGISVYEEGKARQEWGREMEVPFAMALQRKETLKLKDLNAGFTRPETIALAYYQASLLVDHIVTTYGQDALRRCSWPTARASKGGGAGQGAGRVDRQAAGQFRRGGREALRRAAERAADAVERRSVAASRRGEEPRRI